MDQSVFCCFFAKYGEIWSPDSGASLLGKLWCKTLVQVCLQNLVQNLGASLLAKPWCNKPRSAKSQMWCNAVGLVVLWYSGVFGAVVHCRSKSGCVQPQRRSVVVCRAALRAGGLPSWWSALRAQWRKVERAILHRPQSLHSAYHYAHMSSGEETRNDYIAKFSIY